MTDAAFWDRIAPRYAKQAISNVGAYEETLARVQTYLGAETIALELGCGTGSTALRLRPGTKHYVATDISPGMIDIANAKTAEHAGPAPEFRVASVEAAAYTHDNFNTVLAFNLLHLVSDLDALLATIHDILPENGLFISKTPAIGGKWYLRPLIGAMQLFGKAPYVSYMTVADVDACIAAAGFRIEETGLYPPATPSRFIVARKA
ncbi:MAG: class I SAM-dependent methyltransferase [Pseudomonadota bacterium]